MQLKTTFLSRKEFVTPASRPCKNTAKCCCNADYHTTDRSCKHNHSVDSTEPATCRKLSPILQTTLASASALLTSAAAQASDITSTLIPTAASRYVPSPIEGPTWEIYVGLAAGVIPFIIASVEFGKRIVSMLS